MTNFFLWLENCYQTKKKSDQTKKKKNYYQALKKNIARIAKSCPESWSVVKVLKGDKKNCDNTWKLKLWEKKPKNSNCDKTQKL